MSTAWILLLLLPAFGAGERFSCRGRILGGYYADIKSGCRAFHVCVRVAGAGVRDFRFFCPPGTLFQQQAQTCTDWGDDDGLACPTDLDDGQFDLYKIGSGFDTKKVSSAAQRDEEPEFSLQRAETGDRRLHQEAASPPQQQQQSDLRAAHSSDFFSGRRDRGRDEPAQTAPPTSPPAPPSTRAPYRRPPPRVTTFAPLSTPQQSFPESPISYDPQPKRKLVRKRPVHSSTGAPVEFTTASKQYFRATKPDYEKFTAPQQVPTEVPRSSYNENSGFVDVVKVPKAVGRYDAPSEKQQYSDKRGLTEVYNYNSQSTPNYNANINKNNNLNNYNQQKNIDVQNQESNFNNQPNKNFNNQNNNVNNQNRNFNNDNFNNNFNNQKENFNNNENLSSHNNVKNGRSESRQFKTTVRNNFSVAPPGEFTSDNEVRKNVEVSPNGIQRPASGNYQDKSTRNIGSSTPAYRNFNSVSYDAESKSDLKQINVNSQTTPDYEKKRITAPFNINTVAYKTNVGFNARQVNYAESQEDDGQYRLPSGEDDGQYRPELYERDSELLSGAHSLNIAASGNRLPEDQKPRRQYQQSSQAAAPRPFSAVGAPSTQTPRPTENYPTTTKPQPRPQQPQTTTANYHQIYSSTGRSETSPPEQTTFEYSNSVFTTRRPTTAAYAPTTTQFSPSPSSFAPQAFSNKPVAQDSIKSAPVQKKKHQTQPSFAKPVKSNKEDASYDYAYYDSDTGFSEYEQIEEFGKTKTKL